MATFLRQVVIVVTAHAKDSTVSVILRDTSGAARVDRDAGTWRLPLGRVDLTGRPLVDVLRDVGSSVAAHYTRPPTQSGSAPLEGPQGERRTHGYVESALPGL